MKQIVRIVIGLTISCLIAGALMGAVFTLTVKPKKHNAQVNVEETMLSLLGYGRTNPAPADLRLTSIYRYVIEDESGKYLGYVLPVHASPDTSLDFLTIGADGAYRGLAKVDLTREKAREAPDRDAAVRSLVKPPAKCEFADEIVVASMKGGRVAYLLPGEFQGFKTFIHVMLALDPQLKILGLEIMEHEEDPGLGAEITRGYFKNQFRDKPFGRLKNLDVVKQPLPSDYRDALEPKGPATAEELAAIRAKYQESDIYAITGATISSRSVTEGVKGMASRFAYRLGVLEKVISAEQVPAAF